MKFWWWLLLLPTVALAKTENWPERVRLRRDGLSEQ